MTHAQYFCTIDELVTDLDLPGGDVSALLKNIEAASQTILQEIGLFIPVTETRYFNGCGRPRIFIPPLLAVTSIVNDDDTLVSTDYILQPDKKHWPNGPYTWIIPDPDSSTLSAWMDEAQGVAIAGRWGLYEDSAATGATVSSQQAAADTTLAVSDGSKVHPGAVLLIGTEQELVTGYGSPTASVTTLSAAVAAGDESFSVADGTKVKIGEIIRCGVEQMKVLDISTNLLYVRRAYNRTKATAHAQSSAVDVYRTPTVTRAVNGTTAAIHAAAVAINRYKPPEDVNFLCREIATLMRAKADSKFAGRTGNAQTGETFYHDAFPRYDIETVRGHYLIPTVR